MARRKPTIDSAMLGILILVAVPIWIISKITKALGGISAILAFAAVIVFILLLRRHQRAVRLAYLVDKYGDASVADRIMRHMYWQGQTREQLRDSLGNPGSMDDLPMKTRKREIWKYNQQGKNRYGLRITLDNDIVTTWERKN